MIGETDRQIIGKWWNRMAKLPDCMLPDGADPCLGYAELYARIAKLESMRSALLSLVRKGSNDRWYTSQHGDTDVTALIGDALKTLS